MSGAVVWLTGLPSAGKSTLAVRLVARLRALHRPCALLDGDEVRRALVPQPGYDLGARDDFYATLARLAALLAGQGLVAVVAATAHRRAYRAEARRLAPAFLEVFVDVEPEECRRRDAKGLYAARVAALPGADLTYECPDAPEVTAQGGCDEAAASRVIELVSRGEVGR